ncbi:hypothetical protein CBR_g50211 [Chara braunii]|uniref:Uncharacterized protein n=1 Tax=Chara braunii TaxID=69332 RepID=A0A388M6A2_CHABU|nr:hypothetical protein CBR_g50211 [Chara braunii]|eukprot:GBG90118.1 hypothetical protein CBR_g50211 [Chara braunii]
MHGRGRGRGRWSGCRCYKMEFPARMQTPSTQVAATAAQTTQPQGATPTSTIVPMAPPMVHPMAQPVPVPFYQPGYYPPPYGWQGGWNQSGVARPPSTNKFPEPGNRAWFTKEHLKLIEKWKACESSEESRKSEKGESSGGSKSNKKGRGSTESKSSEERLKSWISSTFGTSLNKISEKLDEIEAKTKAKGKAGGSDEKGDGKNEMGSHEKRKRGVNSPALSKAKVRSRTRNGRDAVIVRQPRINISSDDEDEKAKVRTNCGIDVKHEFEGNGGNNNLDEILTLLGALAEKGKEGT